MDNMKAIVSRFEYLEGQRANWDSHYQELADYMLPRKADIVRKRARGEKRMELIFDGTALQYAYQWCNALVSLNAKR